MDDHSIEFDGRVRFCLGHEAKAIDVESLKQWWTDLIQGQTAIVDAFSTATETFLALGPSPVQRPPLRARNLEILERIMLGESSKSVAIDCNLSASTVAAALKQSLQQLGWQQRASTLPVGLIFLAEGARGSVAPQLRCYAGHLPDGLPCHVLTAPLPQLGELLSPAVHEVVHLHMQGKSYLEIAAQRATSTRTVANQVSAAFRLLRISGRNELRHLVAVSSTAL